MSWQACDWMDSLPYDICERLEQRVLLKLCNVADQRGERAFRSKSEIARELGCAPKSVQRAFRTLESLNLILLGDQQLVAHLRGDRRPTVYNLNFGWARENATPELDPWMGDGPLPDDGGTHGGTELSTDELRGDPVSSAKERYSSEVDQESYVPERASAERAAFGAVSQRPAAAWADARCPGNWKTQTHELGTSGRCRHCFTAPARIGASA